MRSPSWHWLPIVLVSLISLAACDGRALPQSATPIGEQQLALSRGAIPGGPAAPVASFPHSRYGSSFARLMTDGTLFFGTPSAVQARRLEPAEHRALEDAWSEEALGTLASGYDLTIERCLREGVAREQCPRLGGPSYEEYRFLDAGVPREVSVANGSASSLEAWSGLVPAVLIAAARALEGVSTGGERWLAPAFVLQAMPEDGDEPDAPVWSIPGLPLAVVAAATSQPPVGTLDVTEPAAVAALHKLFSVGREVYGTFRDGGKLYLVAACPLLPGSHD